MNEFIGARLPSGINKERLKEKAEEYGLSYSALIQRGIQILVGWDVSFYKMLEDRAKRLNLPMGLVIENMLLRRFAESEAKEKVWGESAQILPEFTVVGQRMLTGEELFNYLENRFIQEEQKH